MAGFDVRFRGGGQVEVCSASDKRAQGSNQIVCSVDADGDRKVDFFAARRKKTCPIILTNGPRQRNAAEKYARDARGYLGDCSPRVTDEAPKPSDAKKAQKVFDRAAAGAERLYKDFVKALKEDKLTIKVKGKISAFEFKASGGLKAVGSLNADDTGRVVHVFFGFGQERVLANFEDAKHLAPIQAKLNALHKRMLKKEEKTSDKGDFKRVSSDPKVQGLLGQLDGMARWQAREGGDQQRWRRLHRL